METASRTVLMEMKTQTAVVSTCVAPLFETNAILSNTRLLLQLFSVPKRSRMIRPLTLSLQHHQYQPEDRSEYQSIHLSIGLSIDLLV